MPRLCAFGCKPNDAAMHRFPNLNRCPEQFKVWVNLVGGRLETSSDYEYFKKKRICDIHFTDADKNRNNRLNALAVPSLHIPGARSNEVTAAQPSTSSQRTTQEIRKDAQANRVILVEELTTSMEHSTLPTQTTDTSCGTTTLGRVASEHNYATPTTTVTDKPEPERKPKKGTSAPMYNVVQPLRNKINNLRKQISRLRKKKKSFNSRLHSAEKISSDITFQHVVKNMTKPARLFVHMQLQAPKKAKGRRFTIQEKILSLSLYKKSPKCYALLHKYFTLPSARAMKRLLSEIKISPGINKIVFDKIKKTVAGKTVSDRLCSLMFDEMHLTPQIFYNSQADKLEGLACNKPREFADHALVFMVKSLKNNYKQPVAYYFTNRLNKIELKTMIKTVITHIQESGLIVLNTVCDQSNVNVGAITELISEAKAEYLRRGKIWKSDVININGKNIIPLYDAPHLMKGLRNNLLTKDLVYISNGEEKVVKWEYFQMIYAADKSYGELRLLNKLTEEHVVPSKISKMRVKLATQLFSHSVAVVAEHLAARGDLPVECRQLIDITLLLDNLFDSLNVNSFQIPNGKMYKGPVKKHSPHHQLWKKAKKVLNTIRFRQNKNIGNKRMLVEVSVPSVKIFIKTIEGMEAIWDVVSTKYGFDALLTRHLNQDPAENFFGNIRSYGGRNNAPNTVAFEGAYKSLLLNNYSSPHSSRANCEEDNNKCLQTLEFFLTEKPEKTSDVPKEDHEFEYNEEMFTASSKTDLGQRNYVCGWVLTKCLKTVVKSCQICRQDLIDRNKGNKNNAFIKAKEYEKKDNENNKKSEQLLLCYPSKALENCFHDLQDIVSARLKKDVPIKNIKYNIKSLSDLLVAYPFNCDEHKELLKKYFSDISINVLLHSWCRSINRILSGKITYDGDDEMKLAAQNYYNKHRHNKNKK